MTKHNARTKVIVGMSGGVDSSVSALLLKKQGYQVEGLFMKNWEEDDHTEYCTALADLKDAQAVCDTLDIHLHKANFAAEYWDNVFEHFLHEYRNLRTPNPDVLCNKEIKFKAFLDYALTLGGDYIAMGHYCRRVTRDSHSYLLKAVDNNKDQTYFLHAVKEEQIARTLFPVGNLTKTEVRFIAKKHGLITHNKRDSTGICFIGERRFRNFLQQYLPQQPGAIETDSGQVVGEHCGLMYHTIGQRQGLGIGGRKDSDGRPWYVLDKDPKRNVLIVCQGKDHQLLFSKYLTCSHIDWISEHPQDTPCQLKAKVRYRQQEQDCSLSQRDNGDYLVTFDQPQRAIAPGQSVVFYNDQVCLGGGVIENRPAVSALIC